MIRTSLKPASLASLASLIFLTACQTDLEIALPLSDLNSPEGQNLNATLLIGVPSCVSYEDSRQPSSALEDAMEVVPQVFTGAEYSDCFRQNFDSYAEFTLPVALSDSLDPDDSMIQIVHNEGVELGITVPSRMISEMRRVERESFGMTSFDLGMTIELINDLDSVFSRGVVSSYVDKAPVPFGTFHLAPGESLSIRLSDVSIDQLIAENLTVVLFSQE